MDTWFDTLTARNRCLALIDSGPFQIVLPPCFTSHNVCLRALASHSSSNFKRFVAVPANSLRACLTRSIVTRVNAQTYCLRRAIDVLLFVIPYKCLNNIAFFTPSSSTIPHIHATTHTHAHFRLQLTYLRVTLSCHYQRYRLSL